MEHFATIDVVSVVESNYHEKIEAAVMASNVSQEIIVSRTSILSP